MSPKLCDFCKRARQPFVRLCEGCHVYVCRHLAAQFYTPIKCDDCDKKGPKDVPRID